MTAPSFWNALCRGAFISILALAIAPVFAADDGEDENAGEAPTGDALALYAPEIVWTGQSYVAAGVGVIYTSPDGETWTKVHTTETELAEIALGGGRIVIAGGNAVWIADLGAIPEFTAATLDGANIVDAAFGDGIFVLLDKTGGIWSGDGRGAWQHSSLGADPKAIETCGLAFGNGHWVAAANWAAGMTFTTTDPRGAWTRVDLPKDMKMIGCVAFGANGFVIASGGVSTARSRDGTDWEIGPDTGMDGPAWDLIAVGDTYYLWRDAHVSSTDGLNWEMLSPPESFGWQSLVVRDDAAHILINTDDEQRVTDIAVAAEEAKQNYADYMQAQLDAQPDSIELSVETPERLTAFNGADVNAFALSQGALFAATNAGLFRSEDGRAWTPFGGITTPVTHLVATKRGMLLATPAGLQFGDPSGTFMAISRVNVQPLQLDAADYTFAILGTEGEFFISNDGETWAPQEPLAGARVLTIDLDDSGGRHAVVQVADGVQRYYSYGEHWYLMGEDTLLNSAVRDSAQLADGFIALVDRADQTKPLVAVLRDEWIMHELDTTQAIVDAHHDGYISHLVTSHGEILGFNQERCWRVFAAPNLKFRTVFATGNVLLAGGARGEYVLAPAQVPDAPALIATRFVHNLPPGLELADGAELFKAAANESFVRVVGANGVIYGVTTGGTVQRWNGSRFEPDASFSGVTAVTDVAGTLRETRALAGADIQIRRDNSRSSSSHDNPKLARIFTGPGRWLLLWEGNLAADTHSANTYSKMELAKDFTVRDAAYAAANWVIVGTRADGSGGVITSKGRRWFEELKSTNSPALNAVIHDGTRYIAVGDGGAILTSPTGHTWETHTLPGAPKLIDVAHGAGRTVALAEDGRVFALKNGAWQPVLAEAKNTFRHVAGTPELLVVAGDRLHVTWNAPAVASAPAAPLTEPTSHVAMPGESVRSLLWDGKQFLAMTENLIFTSPNGRDFTPQEDFIDYIRNTAVFAGRTWVNLGRQIYSAEAGTTNFTHALYTADSRSSVSAQSPEKLVFLGDTKVITIGPDARARDDEGVASPLKSTEAFAFGAGRWVASGRSNSDTPAFATSADLKTWKLVELTDHRDTFGYLVHGNGVFVAMGSNGICLTSRDGETWQAATVGGDGYQRLFFADGRFLAVSDNVFRTSVDGVSWSELPHPVTLGYATTAIARDTLFAFHGGSPGKGAPPPWSLTRLPLPTAAQLAAAKPLPPQPYVGFGRLIAEWDEKLTHGPSETERLTATGVLLTNWRRWYPGYTEKQLFDFIHGMYDRVLGYDVTDTSVWYFPNAIEEFSPALLQAFLNQQPSNIGTLWRQINDDIIKAYGQQHPKRVQEKHYSPEPAKGPAPLDVAAVRLRAASGDPGAAYDLSSCYSQGLGVPHDTVAASYWNKVAAQRGFTIPPSQNTAEERFAAWLQLAKQGSAIAAANIGLRYLGGDGVVSDPEVAVSWYKRAVALGHWEAHWRLASSYRDGHGVLPDVAEAKRLVEYAASAAGSGAAYSNLAFMHEIGAGVPRDLAKAAEYFAKAAELGDAFSRRRLADLHLAGWGVTKDEARARVLLQEGVAAGDKQAELALTNLAAGKHEPMGLRSHYPPRRSSAVFDLAARETRAQAGDPAACYDLARAYARGIGVEPSREKSEAWLAQANTAGLKTSGDPLSSEEAFARTKTLADQGSLFALSDLVLRYANGQGTPADQSAATATCQRMIENGSWSAHVELATRTRTGKGIKVDPAAALRLLQAAAKLGYGPALYELGWSYEAGAGTSRDLAQAAAYYQQAADAGYTSAWFRLADYHASGWGVAKDPTKARAFLAQLAAQDPVLAGTVVQRFDDGKYQPRALQVFIPPQPRRPLFDIAARRAQAEAGDPAACYDLAYALWHGYGVDEDDAAGHRWFATAKQKGWKQPELWDTPENTTISWRAAAELGSIVALGEIAFRTSRGTGIAADYAGAVPLFERAANAGHVNALAELGLIYEHGRGLVAADATKSMDCYQRAADAGNAYAQMKIGYAHDTGTGRPADDVAAARYYRLAAEGGNETAAANFADFLALGVGGVPKDERAAAAWYLELTGLPQQPTEPTTAYAQLKAELARGNIEALAPLAIMHSRGFGTTIDVTEAWALAYAARYFETGIYAFSWFADNAVITPVALRRAAQLVTDLSIAELQAMAEAAGDTDDVAATVAAMNTVAASRETSQVARALTAIAQGSARAEDAAALVECGEPLAIPSFGALWQPYQEYDFPNGQPWFLRLAGITDAPTEESPAEKTLQLQLLALPDEEADRKHLDALRRLVIARLFYGIDRDPDPAAALAWAMVNDDTENSLTAIDFIAHSLNAEQLAAADALYGRIQEKLNERAASWW